MGGILAGRDTGKTFVGPDKIPLIKGRKNSPDAPDISFDQYFFPLLFFLRGAFEQLRSCFLTRVCVHDDLVPPLEVDDDGGPGHGVLVVVLVVLVEHGRDLHAVVPVGEMRFSK